MSFEIKQNDDSLPYDDNVNKELTSNSGRSTPDSKKEELKEKMGELRAI